MPLPKCYPSAARPNRPAPTQTNHGQAISTTATGRQVALGMAGIADKKEISRAHDDQNIDLAFSAGLKGLEQAAKEMIKLSQKISREKIGKTGALSEDENVQFRNHLMTLGIGTEDGDQVQAASGSSGGSVLDAGQELFKALREEARGSGNFLLLSDVFCVVNRIKGLDLISPEDTLKFVTEMVGRNERFCQLIRYESGAMALEFVDGGSGGVGSNSFEGYFEKCLLVDEFEYLRVFGALGRGRER